MFDIAIEFKTFLQKFHQISFCQFLLIQTVVVFQLPEVPSTTCGVHDVIKISSVLCVGE